MDYSSYPDGRHGTFKAEVDGVVVWGGKDAVEAYRNQLPARTKCIVFGPKLSVAVLTERGIKRLGVDETATRLADEISIWDQNACTAPQMCFVEGEKNARLLVESLAARLEEEESETLPCGPADVDTAVEIQKVRGISEMEEALGWVFSGRGGKRRLDSDPQDEYPDRVLSPTSNNYRGAR